jgi:hypothetical protein
LTGAKSGGRNHQGNGFEDRTLRRRLVEADRISEIVGQLVAALGADEYERHSVPCQFACEWPDVGTPEIDIEHSRVEIVLSGKLQPGRQIQRRADHLAAALAQAVVEVLGERGIVLDHQDTLRR